jgi:hypothetical protein
VYPGGSAEEHLVGESRIAPSSDLVTGKICWETDEVRTLNPDYWREVERLTRELGRESRL